MKIENIPLGFRDIYSGVADEAIENPVIVAVSGNGTQSVTLTDKKTIELVVNGDGDIGSNAFQVSVDGHVGDGEVAIVTDFEYDVVSADATTVQFTKVRREAIPPSV